MSRLESALGEFHQKSQSCRSFFWVRFHSARFRYFFFSVAIRTIIVWTVRTLCSMRSNPGPFLTAILIWYVIHLLLIAFFLLTTGKFSGFLSFYPLLWKIVVRKESSAIKENISFYKILKFQLGYIIGSIAALCYFGGRIPQIMKVEDKLQFVQGIRCSELSKKELWRPQLNNVLHHRGRKHDLRHIRAARHYWMDLSYQVPNFTFWRNTWKWLYNVLCTE